MITIFSLWLAILISAVFVFIASFLVWAVLPYHKSDYKAFPDEDATRKALLPQDLKPGQYSLPHRPDRKDYEAPEVKKMFEEGPAGFFTVLPKGMPGMGKSMIQSIIFYLFVSFCVAYVASRTLAPGAEYLSVFRLTSTVTWMAYGFGTVMDAIWFGRPWSAIIKNLFDALIYALLVAGVFGWLWP